MVLASKPRLETLRNFSAITWKPKTLTLPWKSIHYSHQKLLNKSRLETMNRKLKPSLGKRIRKTRKQKRLKFKKRSPSNKLKLRNNRKRLLKSPRARKNNKATFPNRRSQWRLSQSRNPKQINLKRLNQFHSQKSKTIPHLMIKLHKPRTFQTLKQARLKWQSVRVGLKNNKSPRRSKLLPEAITKTIAPITMELGIIKARTHTTIAQEIITTTKRNRERTGMESTKEITDSNINTRESRLETKIKQEGIKEKTVIHLWSRLLRKIRFLISLSTSRKID